MRETTIEKMNGLKLFGMVRALEAAMMPNFKEDLTADELIAHLIDAEWDDRNNRRLNRLIKRARFRYHSSFDKLDFRAQRNLDKNAMLKLSSCDWIPKARTIVITGPTGVGKSFIACALGNLACHNGHSVMYFNCTKLFSLLKTTKADGSYAKLLRRIEAVSLLILDDLGLEPFDKITRLAFLEILEDRHGKNATLLTSQLPPAKWHDIIGEPTIADAICDRLVHSAIKIQLKGGSLRKNSE